MSDEVFAQHTQASLAAEVLFLRKQLAFFQERKARAVLPLMYSMGGEISANNPSDGEGVFR
jgi:hypothetical protein